MTGPRRHGFAVYYEWIKRGECKTCMVMKAKQIYHFFKKRFVLKRQ
jgi:hypothetical protein